MSDKLNAWLFRFVFICVFALHSVLINAQAVQPTLKLALFDVDATPPVGTQLTYDPMLNDWDLGLRAKGVVILGAGLPIVMCSVDWIGISNGINDFCNTGLDNRINTGRGFAVMVTWFQRYIKS